jgi:hypothetical protein
VSKGTCSGDVQVCGNLQDMLTFSFSMLATTQSAQCFEAALSPFAEVNLFQVCKVVNILDFKLNSKVFSPTSTFMRSRQWASVPASIAPTVQNS